MTGTHYTLDRDVQNPMDVVKEKPCKRCGQVKPNTFEHFGKKWWKSRTVFTTNDVCNQCKATALADAHARKAQEERDYHEYLRERERARLRALGKPF